MQIKETKALVLYNRAFREEDRLVKLFTETSGKYMFFVKNAGKSKLSAVIQPLTVANFILKLNDNGLSYIEDYRDVKLYKNINSDIFRLAYASYLVALSDAAIVDAVYDAPLFAFLIKTLDLLDEGLDEAILTNIFEIQILERFGVQLNFHDCTFCHRVGLAFDFSHRYSGLLCPEHYDKDPHRSHLDPNVFYLLDRFQQIQFDELRQISVKAEMKEKLRIFIDSLYDDYVGLHLKSKKFIDDLGKWGHIMKDNVN